MGLARFRKRSPALSGWHRSGRERIGCGRPGPDMRARLEGRSSHLVGGAPRASLVPSYALPALGQAEGWGAGPRVPFGFAAGLPCRVRRGSFALDGGEARAIGGCVPRGAAMARGGRGTGALADGTARGGRGLAHRARSAARRERVSLRQNRSLLRVAQSPPGGAVWLAGGMGSDLEGEARRLERGGRRPGVRRGPAERAGSLAMRKRRPASRAADSRIGGEVGRVIGR